MPFTRTLLFLIVFGGFVPSVALAQRADPLASYAAKANLTREDRAAIRVTVIDRARELETATDDHDREQAAKTLVDSMQLPRATNEFKDVYAEICADQLDSALSSRSMEAALSAALVLRKLNNPAVTPGLVRALNATHASVRYSAATTIRLFHGELKKAAEVTSLADALGRTGRGETDRLVLRAVYEGLRFPMAEKNAAAANAVADSLISIFDGRLRRLQDGSHNEAVDVHGFRTAEFVYKAAAPERQLALRKGMLALAKNAMDRYLSPATSAAAKASLRTVYKEAEQVLLQMIRQSGGNAPSPANLTANTPADDARAAYKRLEESVQRLS